MTLQRPLKVLVKSPFSLYSGYGADGFGLLRALSAWGADVYPQPTWLDVPVPPDLLPLFGKTLAGPFDLVINHWDPANLKLARSAREMCRVSVGWTMWEFAGAAPDAVAPCARHQDQGAMGRADCPDCIPCPGRSGLVPHCERTENSTGPDGSPREDGLRSRLQWFDLVLGYDSVSLEALRPYIPDTTRAGVLQGGYDSSQWKPVERDWTGDRFQFVMHGALGARKQPWLAIAAFQQLRYDKGEQFAGARLALHTNAPGTLFPELNSALGAQGIRVFVDSFDSATLREFYRSGHCLLAPSRGEGKNLPALEFLSTAGTVIATNFGGHTGWLSGDWAYPLDYQLAPTFGDKPWGPRDAKVDVDHLAQVMWHVYTHRDEARRKGELAADVIPRMCDWGAVLEKLFQRIRDEVPGPGPQVYDAAMACRRDAEEVTAGRMVL